MSRFVLPSDLETVDYDWGSIGMRCSPSLTGCDTFVVLDVTLGPGAAHPFHTHPDQDELIVIKSGRVVQWVEREHRVLGPGESVYIDKNVVHASYNDFDEAAELQVILAPPAGDSGYETVDVSGAEPWRSMK